MASWRSKLAAWISGAKAAPRGVRLYGGARTTRTTGGFGGAQTSADAELSSSLSALRSRARQAVRDAAYAKRAKAVIVNNVIGTGMGMQAQVVASRSGELAERVNTGIEAAWSDWAKADSCHAGGALAFGDLERAAMGEVFEAGEVFVRLHYRSLGRSRVPLGLEIIEAERIASDHEVAQTTATTTRMGVELDEFQRPVAYWIRSRHPGDWLPGEPRNVQIQRVPAADILHLRVVSRWPQTRGEPWMHAVIRKLDDLSEYSQHEITAAKASAAYFATIKSPEQGDGLASDVEDDGQQVMDIEPLTIQALQPGEELSFHAPNRPNSAFAEFNRAMLREIAAGLGVSYEAVSRDYSQSNYSSSRLALLDDRDTYRALQQWWVRSFREPLHRIWLQQAVVARAIPEIGIDAYWVDQRRYEAVLFKPRGWSWVDPTKEVNAYKKAIRAGMTTLTDVIAATAGGQDIEDVIAIRQRELRMLDKAGIPVDTTGAQPTAAAAPAPEPPDAEDDSEDSAQTSSSSDRLRRIT